MNCLRILTFITRQQTNDIFLIFAQKTGFDISCKLSTLEIIFINVKSCFLKKKKKKKNFNLSSAENFTKIAKHFQRTPESSREVIIWHLNMNRWTYARWTDTGKKKKIKYKNLIQFPSPPHHLHPPSPQPQTSASLVSNKLFHPVLHFYQVSKYCEGYSSYRADTKSNSNTRGGNSKSKKATVVILLCNRSSHPVLHFYQVKFKSSKRVRELQSRQEINSNTRR